MQISELSSFSMVHVSKKKAQRDKAHAALAKTRAAAIRRTRFFDASENTGECLLARACR